jgi:predicted peptidase
MHPLSHQASWPRDSEPFEEIMHPHLRFLPIALLLFAVGCFHPNPNNKLKDMPKGTGFTVRSVKSGGEDHKYSVFVPRDYQPAKKYPTIVFLHGIGESGTDGVKCTTVGLGPAIAKRKGNFPFIAIFPQYGWDWTGDEAGRLVLDVLDDVKRQYSIDEDRVTLTGMSSGGRGTWVLGARYPERWNALVPMAGQSSTDDVPKLARTKIPIWALHNSGDPIVFVSNTRDMVKKLKSAGANVTYKEYSTIGHNCWDAAYDEGELFEWLQRQRRSNRPS